MRIASVLSLIFASPLFHNSRAAADDVNFNRDVKPILSQNCFQCHGPDDAHRAARLRLDRREYAIRPAESGAIAISSSDPDQSELLVRINSVDADQRMPPAETGKTLTAEQIETLQKWIAEGAEYEEHWAFQAPTRPKIPTVAGDFPVQNAVDSFIAARLEKEGLRFSPEANRETLIRRVSLDVTGLPATPAEVDAFIADSSPDAWERLIDRLLASPQYGERMAISWLDNARYADSNGYQSDGSRDIWAWRGWVINAYNANMPFDQFTVEQLAGDMLPSPTRDQIIATGFNRNHRLNGEGGRIEQEWFVETVIDRVETTGLTWLGLTFNCCRCHDHKYDPITQREFYQLFAYFNSVEESGVLSPKGRNGENSPPLLALTTPEQDAQLSQLQEAAAVAREQRDVASARITELLSAWEVHLQNRVKREIWKLIEPQRVESLGGAQFMRQDDGSWLATGSNPANDEYQIEVPLATTRLSGILLEVFPDTSLPSQSLGRGHNGNFVLTGVSAEILTEETEPQVVAFTSVQADYEQPNYTASQIQLGRLPATGRERSRAGWAIDGNDPSKMVPRRIYFAPLTPVEVPRNAVLVVRMTHDSQFADHNVGRIRISVSDADSDQVGLGNGGIPAEIQTILQLAAETRTPAQIEQLRRYFREQTDNPIRTAEAALLDAQAKLTDFEDGLSTTMVMKESARRDAVVLTRGEYDRPADKVERNVPAFLPPLPPGVSNDRLGLAQWIVSDSNPLTARVWINRQWERLFGIGIVKTSENLGSQAEFPSHPELLDWLAVEFMRPTVLPAVNGVAAKPWDMKAIQKLILMSAAYRQSSKVEKDILHRDPNNRLLSRGSRFRLPAELIRDQTLAVSGLLVSKIGGPSVRPYMPDGVWDETSKYGNLRGYQHETGDGLYRRTMYTIWKRTAAPPTMLLFDAPNREVCTITRSRTNTPLQALALLNEVTYVEAARALAVRLISEGGSSTDERMTFGFRLVTGRRPSVAELQVLVAGFDEDHATFLTSPEAARQLLATGELPAATEIDPVLLAAWTVTANVLLNLDEFVTRE